MGWLGLGQLLCPELSCWGIDGVGSQPRGGTLNHGTFCCLPPTPARLYRAGVGSLECIRAPFLFLAATQASYSGLCPGKGHCS